MQNTDVAVVGGGIVGLAFAYAYAKRGRKVTLFERSEFAVGASVRNFGLLWPVGQRLGRLHERALRSREIWLEVIQKAGLWSAPTGSLHLAYSPDEWAVLQEYFALLQGDAFQRELLQPAQVPAHSAVVRTDGLLGALWSPTEVNIDPREAIRSLPDFLKTAYDVDLRFGVQVSHVSLPRIATSAGDWSATETVICSGADFETLYPEVFAGSGLTRCKLQMLRTVPQPRNWHLGPSLCAGLTLAHYDCFQDCPTLPKLKQRLQRDYPFHVANGIHLLLSETSHGQLTIGDSHHYGQTLEPFDREDVNEAILAYLRTFAALPKFEIAERWHGVYPKLPGRSEFIAYPAPGVLVASGLGGAGMTLAFGLADECVGALK